MSALVLPFRRPPRAQGAKPAGVLAPYQVSVRVDGRPWLDGHPVFEERSAWVKQVVAVPYRHTSGRMRRVEAGIYLLMRVARRTGDRPFP